MALRLINHHQHPLRIDLRGGQALVLAPGQRSEALREELLYDNCHLREWERAGWIARVPARFVEVGRPDQAVPAKPRGKKVTKKVAAPKKSAAKKVAAKKAVTKKATKAVKAVKALWPQPQRPQPHSAAAKR